ELMVLRVDPGSFSAGDLDYASTNLYVSIYENTDSGVILAAEKQLTLTCGLGWGNTSNVFSLFRYISQTGDDLEDDPPQVNLGFDYYCSLSGPDLTFGLIALTYDGANLLLADGLECMEDADENYAAMYVASDEGALTNLTGRMYRNEENGWSTNDRNNGDGFYGFEGDFTDYEACFDQLLRVRFDLWDELAFRSMYGELKVSSVSGLAYVIGLSPAELYEVNNESSITGLCSIQAPYCQGGIMLTCEDDGGLLDSYRGNADTNLVETDSDETIIVLSATIDG
ncbi:MAG: hypothetical protein LUH53_01415, partial [Lachnospiraceae bacterium]|nr:hypothetical protein [Lachnospiraceae bacterium]